jgi:adenylylsulfate kinase-like enzyme
MNPIPTVFWFFGRSGAGKTTLAQRLRDGLLGRRLPVVFLDADDLRSGLSSDLGFTPEGRLENHRRIAEIARLLVRQQFTVIVSTMAPEHRQRDLALRILGRELVWFYIDAPLEECIRRDPKGLYRRALAGQVARLIDYPFDAPRPSESRHRIDTVARNVDDCYQAILAVAAERLDSGPVKTPPPPGIPAGLAYSI